MVIMSRRQDDAGAAQPTLLNIKDMLQTLYSVHNVRVPKKGRRTMSAVEVRDKFSHLTLHSPPLVFDHRVVTATQK